MSPMENNNPEPSDMYSKPIFKLLKIFLIARAKQDPNHDQFSRRTYSTFALMICDQTTMRRAPFYHEEQLMLYEKGKDVGPQSI